MDHGQRYTHRVHSSSNILGRPPLFYDSRHHRPVGTTFISVYAVTAEDADHIHRTGTAFGYRGTVWSRRLWVDYDSYEAARAAKSCLKDMGLNYVAYDTGGRGEHLGIARDASPSHLLPAMDKQWVEKNLPGADLSLYWHLHLIRLPGTVHEKTGRSKVLIEEMPGQVLTLPPYTPEEAQTVVPIPQGARESVFKCWTVVEKLQLEPGKSRHAHLVALTKALQADAKVTLDEASWFVLEVNRGFDEPKPEEEVLRIVRWAYER